MQTRTSVACAVLLVSLAARGDAASPAQAAAKDEAFVKAASAAGLAEVQLGQLGVERSTKAEVRQFAQRMIDDHSKANEELTSIASQAGYEPASEPNNYQKRTYDRLNKMSGEAFDHAFMGAMLQDHLKAVELFTEQAGSGTQPTLKDFASRTLPTLKEHLEHARGLASH